MPHDGSDALLWLLGTGLAGLLLVALVLVWWR